MKERSKKNVTALLLAAMLACTAAGGTAIATSATAAEAASAAQSATSIAYKTYGIDWESAYGADGYVVLGDVDTPKEYYTDMQQDNDGTVAVTDSSWKNSSNQLTSFSPKDTAPISTLAYGTVVWKANNDVQTYNLYKPGTTEQLKTRAHQNSGQKYYADVYAGFTLKGDDAIYATVNVSDHNNKISTEYPVTISVYASSVTNTNAEAYANNANPERYKTIDTYYAGTDGEALATTTVTAQSANVTFKLEGAGEYRIVAYYDNPTAVDEEGNMVTTGTNSPICPQINGFFFDYENPLSEATGEIDQITGSSWQGVYGGSGYVIMDYDSTATAADAKKIAYTKGIYTQNGEAYQGKVAYTDASTKYSYNASDVNYQPEWQAADSELALSNTLISRYGLNATNWEYKSWLDGSEQSNGTIYSENQLKKPDSNERVAVRVGGPNNADLGASVFALTVTETAVQSGAIYVTAYHNNAFDGYKDNAKYTVELYDSYYSSNYVDSFSAVPVAATETVSVKNTNFYTTFTIKKAGDYSICIEGESGKARGAIQAIFFDTTKPAPSTSGTYKINYVVENGTNANTNPATYTFADGVESFAPAVSNNGMIFDGWYQDPTYSKPITSVPAGMNVELTLYAKFITPFTISYEVGTGTNATDNPTAAANGSKITLKEPTPPAHYYFDGWFTTANFDASSRVTGEYTVTGDVTFYAKFLEVARYTITYVLDGGVNSDSNPTEYYSGEGVSSFAAATKEGYDFEGWFFDEEYSQQINAIPAEYNANVTLYAKFVKTVVVSYITYVLDGGTNAVNNPVSYTEGEAVALEAASKDGYTFDGWYLESAFATKVTEISATQTGDVTLYAKFTAIETNDPEPTPEPDGNGCAGTVGGVGVLMLLTVAGVALWKKKEN